MRTARKGAKVQRALRLSVFACFLLLLRCVSLHAQDKQALSFKDSSDGKFDVSDWVLNYNGFIPLPTLITEPALGNIGGALFFMFIDQNVPYTDTVDGKVTVERIRPNFYGLGGAYTANGTWLGAGAVAAVIRPWRAHFRLATGFANVNMTFYREVLGEEHSFEFTLRTMPIYNQFLKQIGRGHWFAGYQYLFLNMEIKTPNSEFISSEEIKRQISRLGALVEFDGRDNIFTPNKGIRWNTVGGASDEAIGSDYNFTFVNSAGYFWTPVQSDLIAGFRAEYQQTWGDAPFYMLPYINMRGIPTMRYQGRITTLAETEWRWDFASRFSAVVFGGAGKAVMDWDEFGDSDWHGTGGIGGRYLIARRLGLRMGIDVAHGPEDWGYYMVFGTNWVR